MRRICSGAVLMVGVALMMGADARQPAQARYYPPSPFFSLADADNDGKITGEELKAAFQRLRQADTNKDGVIDVAEYRVVSEAIQMVTRFKYYDKNNDGKLAPGEMRYGFERADANEDGFVSPEEYAESYKRRMAYSRMPMSERIMGMDADKDGKVSLKEFSWGERYFQRYDADKDGFISKEEAAKTPSWRTRRPGGGQQPRQDQPKAGTGSTGTPQPAPKTDEPDVEGVPKVEN